MKILQQSGQVFSSGSDTVKLYDLVVVVVYVLDVINALVRMHKIRAKKVHRSHSKVRSV